jgi:hypothetical protein
MESFGAEDPNGIIPMGKSMSPGFIGWRRFTGRKNMEMEPGVLGGDSDMLPKTLSE